jgi:hypothetical protein
MELHRRQLLQAAILGAAGVSIAGVGSGLSAPALADSTDDGIDVTEGTLVSLQGSVAVIQQGLDLVQYDLSNANVWRGAYDLSPSALVPGDEVMVKTVASTAVAAWSNLSRARGLLLTVGQEPTVQANGAVVPLLGLDTASWFDALNEPSGPITLNLGDRVDVIGLETPTGLLANRIQVAAAAPDPAPVYNTVDDDDGVVAVAQNCIYTYGGVATWFSCDSSISRCRTACNPGSGYGCAWPALDSVCSGCTVSCCNCSKNCKNQVYLSCGKQVTVIDKCSAKTLKVTIVECGPHQNGACGQYCCRRCTNKCKSDIVDLTKAAYTKFYEPGPNGTGCFEAKAQVVVTVPGTCA